MMKWKKVLAVVLSFSLIAGALSHITLAKEGKDTGDRFVMDGVKYQTARVAQKNEVFSDARAGLLLYSYDSGSTATFKETFSGPFEIETKAVADKIKPALSTYTLHFTNAITGESFSVNITDIGTELQASVSVGEDATGVFYNYEMAWDDKAHGHTVFMNQNERYTAVLGANTAIISFDPETMEVKLKNTGGTYDYKTIWCLKEEVMDGKRFPHTFQSFESYNVSIELTAVGEGQKGELLLYNVNGEDYGKANLPEVQPMIRTNLQTYAVVGQEYVLPNATIYGSNDDATSDITCTVFDTKGKEVVSDNVSEGVRFTPKKTGTYYLYYKANGTQEAESYVQLPVYEKKQWKCGFSKYTVLPESVGVQTTLLIPERKVESPLFMAEEPLYADITVKKEEQIVAEKASATDELEVTLETTGTYTIVWSYELLGKTFEEKTTVLVDDSIPGIVGAQFETDYDMDSVLTIPKATVYVGGNSYDATTVVVKPSGIQTEEVELTLDEIGNYNVVYTCDAGGEKLQFERTFQVNYPTENLFEAGEDTSVYFDDTMGNVEMSGVQVDLFANTSSVTYTKTLDLSDNTKHDTMLELYAIPSKLGAIDLTGFYVTLTDKLDPSNCISIRMVSDSMHGVYIRGKATGQPGYVGLKKSHGWDAAPYEWHDVLEDTMAHDKSGFFAYFDMAYNLLEYDLQDKTLVLRYDAKEKAIYSSNLFELVHDKNYREDLVIDFDDPNMFASVWPGFTDDSQVEMKITPMSVSGKATLKILEVDGTKLNQKYLADKKAPEVSVDYLGMNGAPNGKVGIPYPLFDVIAEDNLCDTTTLTIKKKATFNGKEVEIKDNAFIPEQAGLYQIHYAVSDGFGNTTKKIVDVVIKKDVPEVSISMKEKFSERMAYGMTFYAPTLEGKGGSGVITTRTYYMLDGKETEFVDCFVPMAEGEYTVVCEAKDYIGQIAKASKTYNIVFQPEVIIEDKEVVVPEVLLADKTYQFEDYIASYYEAVGQEPKELHCDIEVTDAEGTRMLEANRIYVPKMSENQKEAKIRFIFKATVNGKEIAKEIQRTVLLHSVRTDSQFMADYFIGTNAKINPYNRFMTIGAKKNTADAKVNFVKAISARNFSIVLKASENDKGKFCSAYEKLRLTLTDKLNPLIKVQFDVIKNGNELELSINGGGKRLLPGTLTEVTQKNLVISYDNTSYTVRGAENALINTVTDTLSGNEFTGFTSDEVFLSMEILGVKGESAIDLISINNQTFLSAAQDNTTPELFVNGSYSGLCSNGDVVTIPTADAYDVLNYVTTTTVSVQAPDGSDAKAEDGTVLKEAPADKEYQVKVTQMGQYVITYSATDEAGRTTTVSKSYTVHDSVLPTIELKGKFPKSVKAGKTVRLKKYTIKDNGDTKNVKVTIYLGKPNGMMEQVKGNKVSTDEKGIYYIYYYLTDENGNTNVQTYMFEAR